MTKKPKMEHVAIPNTVFHHMRGSFVIRPKCLSWLKGQRLATLHILSWVKAINATEDKRMLMTEHNKQKLVMDR
jgi:hypothetical protein